MKVKTCVSDDNSFEDSNYRPGEEIYDRGREVENTSSIYVLKRREKKKFYTVVIQVKCADLNLGTEL